uniref:Putative secreted protein n=1 Tax=Panstrongylus lignarius TaxID=156445 RepID=A0A224XXK7_9HEMI
MKPIPFLLAVLFMLHYCAEAQECPGCPHDVDPNDAETKKVLVALLAERNEEYDLVKITKAQSQMVTAHRYSLDFEVTDRRTNEKKTCKTSLISQPWLSKRIVEVFSCV